MKENTILFALLRFDFKDVNIQIVFAFNRSSIIMAIPLNKLWMTLH